MLLRRFVVTLLFGSSVLSAASKAPVRAPHGMVASTSQIASQIGSDVMRRGGNAVDAAVAVGFALSVTWPSAGNLGGGGFMLIRKSDGTVEAIDYRERAPLAANRDMYLGADGNVVKGLSTDTHLGAGVPGTVRGLELAHQRHGKLPWKELIEPAVRLAEEGFRVNIHLARSLRGREKKLVQSAESRRIFLREGKLWNENDWFEQPDLARTLVRIRDEGSNGFYRGETARLIVEEMKRGNGIITLEDLDGYTATIRTPLRGTYRGHEIITMPPPSSGGIALLSMLNMLEHYDIAAMGPHSADALHLQVEIMRRAFADRASFLGDTDFAQVPLRGLISKEYAKKRRATIDLRRATPSRKIGAGDPLPYESPDTTHFSVVDREGNVVSNTYTINDSYGSGITVTGAGFLLNDEMDDFTSKPGVPNAYNILQSEANAIEPRKRPLSSMTPTIVLRDGDFWFAIGSPGGPTIINTVFQTIVNVIDFKMTLQQAIDAPRVHHQHFPDEIYWEPFGINPDVRRTLERRGFRFRDRADPMGDAEGVMIEKETGMRLGASDPRIGGVPVGY
jgi:gamma-glutamyltranspeptidase / glutathione hydrolase